jgi:hypothetical protein
MTQRLREPSTWAGLAALASVLRGVVPGGWWLDLVAAAAAAVAVKMPEARP